MIKKENVTLKRTKESLRQTYLRRIERRNKIKANNRRRKGKGMV